MLDDMFSFIDPIFSTDESSLSEFIVQMETFFTYMEQKKKVPIKLPRPLSEETYKEMWMLRYKQHMGQMTFLELLDKYEEILGISSSNDST
jgi:hypothetical protein